jgi:hypothetical protein
VHEDVGDEHDEDVGGVRSLQIEKRSVLRVGKRRWKRTKTYLSETPETQDKRLRGEDHPLDALHLLATILIRLSRILNDEIVAATVEEAGVALPDRSLHLLESDVLGFEGEGGEIVEELGRTDKRLECEGLDGEVEGGLSLNLEALAVDLVAVLYTVEGERGVGIEKLLDLTLAVDGHRGRDFDNHLTKPHLDGIFRGRLGGGDGRPETGRGGEGDRRVAVEVAGGGENVVVVEEEVGVSDNLQVSRESVRVLNHV